jgi:hypothetical protein
LGAKEGKMIKSRKFIILAAVCLVGSLFIGVLLGIFPFPFIGRTSWAIGIYEGESPLILSGDNIQNPVLTAEDVMDVPADFIADPFMIHVNQWWYMYFEVSDTWTGRNEIGLATSRDGIRWTYRQIVIRESFDLSYPYVFSWEGEYYIIPESNKVKAVRLYKAVDFPTKWVFVGNLVEGLPYRDSSIIRQYGKWWLFTSLSNDNLEIYFADILTGPWKAHPKNPIINGNANIARSGGRVTMWEGQMIRYAQDCDPNYGNQVRAFHVKSLTVDEYKAEEVKESPVLKPDNIVWRKQMHTIDPHQIGTKKWIACVDGQPKKLFGGFKYFNW